MGKRNKLREAQQCADELALAALLRLHKKSHTRDQYSTWRDLPQKLIDSIRDYGGAAIRDLDDWHGPPRSMSVEDRYLDLVRFMFERYRVPGHLARAWLDDGERPNMPDFRRWHIAAAQGRSLYPIASEFLLTRIETHRFLTAPSVLKDCVAALWYAMAMSGTQLPRHALKVARCRIVDQPIGHPYWRDAAQFLARHPLPLEEMNEIVRFAEAVRADDPDFMLRGRSLAGLRRTIADWKRMEGLTPLTWAGRRQPNKSYEICGESWHFRQLKSTLRLYEEGKRMRHCVADYADQCHAGDTSIWSLTHERNGSVRHCLTVEVDNNGTIWQVRGFGNRAATSEEALVVALWATEHELTGLHDAAALPQAAE